jgi:site-specific recombinase XerD
MEIPSFRLVDGTSALASSCAFEAELAKDRWDARNIPGLRYAQHTGSYYIRFTTAPDCFRPLLKAYAKFQIASGRTAGTISQQILHLGHFFTFFVQRYPNTFALHDLTKQDIDAFIVHLKATMDARGKPTSETQVGRHVERLEGLLSYLERSQNPMRPEKPTACLIWPHHHPAWKKSESERVKYVPQFVLSQLDAHLHQLAPACIPVMIVLRASGWRLSDVLYLKSNTCLELNADKYWLVGDIQKTRLLGHRIPITKEVALVIQAQITWVKQQYPEEENPHGWLFPASNKSRHRSSQRFQRGNPLAAHAIQERLNHLAITCHIRGENGEIYHFRPHAFRHAKAVELINNGMSLIMVQQWMAHASPEMTLIYAKILDETMRTAWEKTVQQGIVQFNDGKPEFVSGKKLLPMAGSNAFDPERVRAHRQNVKMALGSCLKTAKIVCKFVELPCFHCPAYVLTPDDLPALEAYEQQIIERIEVGKQAGNVHWLEVNQKNLDERVRPAIALLREDHIVAKTDKQEREYTDEEWEQRQHTHQEEIHG